jgi:hypothetical protein
MTLTGNGWFAEVEVGGYGLRLVCVETGIGIAANVYSHKDQGWSEPPIWVHNFDEGKSMAERRARQLLDAINRLKLPNVEWKKIETRS